MLENRFSEFWETSELQPTQSHVGFNGVGGAFVLCPCSFSMPQYSLMEQVYRLAYAQAHAQVSKTAQRSRVDFSIN